MTVQWFLRKFTKLMLTRLHEDTLKIFVLLLSLSLLPHTKLCRVTERQPIRVILHPSWPWVRGELDKSGSIKYGHVAWMTCSFCIEQPALLQYAPFVVIITQRKSEMNLNLIKPFSVMFEVYFLHHILLQSNLLTKQNSAGSFQTREFTSLGSILAPMLKGKAQQSCKLQPGGIMEDCVLTRTGLLFLYATLYGEEGVGT